MYHPHPPPSFQTLNSKNSFRNKQNSLPFISIASQHFPFGRLNYWLPGSHCIGPNGAHSHTHSLTPSHSFTYLIRNDYYFIIAVIKLYWLPTNTIHQVDSTLVKLSLTNCHHNDHHHHYQFTLSHWCVCCRLPLEKHQTRTKTCTLNSLLVFFIWFEFGVFFCFCLFFCCEPDCHFVGLHIIKMEPICHIPSVFGLKDSKWIEPFGLRHFICGYKKTKSTGCEIGNREHESGCNDGDGVA